MSARLGWLEKAMMLVPGYRGYKKRELLREDDRLLRGYVADLLRQASNNLQQAISEIVRLYGVQAQQMLQQPGNPLSVLEWLRQRIYGVATEVEHAEAGYQPSFDRLKVKEDELRRLREIDNGLVGFANLILETSKIILDQIRGQRSFDPRYTLTIQQALDELERIVGERRRFLHGSGEVIGSDSNK